MEEAGKVSIGQNALSEEDDEGRQQLEGRPSKYDTSLNT